MQKKISFSDTDLQYGTCQSCGEQSTEIIIDDEHGRCFDCYCADDFYEETMKGLL
jgi:hypothetical protein